jgi:hypothetical protein
MNNVKAKAINMLRQVIPALSSSHQLFQRYELLPTSQRISKIFAKPSCSGSDSQINFLHKAGMISTKRQTKRFQT